MKTFTITRRSGAIFAIAFCAVSWAAIGDGVFRVAHDGRGPGISHGIRVVAHKSIKRIEQLG